MRVTGIRLYRFMNISSRTYAAALAGANVACNIGAGGYEGGTLESKRALFLRKVH